jgi:hypothetical protein
MTSFAPVPLLGVVICVLSLLPGARGIGSFRGLMEDAVLATLDTLLAGPCSGLLMAARDGIRVIIFLSSFRRVKMPDMMWYIPSGSAASSSLKASATLATASRLLESAVLSSTSWQDIPIALVYSLRPKMASFDDDSDPDDDDVAEDACCELSATVDAVEKREFLVGDVEAAERSSRDDFFAVEGVGGGGIVSCSFVNGLDTTCSCDSIGLAFCGV